MKSASLDYWRSYFRTANSDIFEIIDHAIIVAVSDCPKEFRLRRDRIAERLFSCNLTRCSGCNQLELTHHGQTDERRTRGDGNGDVEIEGCGFDAGASKESKVNSCDLNDQLVSNYSYGEAEALTDEIDEQSQILDEVYRIKNILLNSRDESDTVLFDSLRRLQLMALTVDTLKATEIGKPVNLLRKHGAKQVRDLARTLIDGWKVMVDEWYSSAKPVGGDEVTPSPECVNPSPPLDEEEGLPSPPLDEEFFFTAQATGIELSQFFDGMDDDGNPRKRGESNKNHQKERKPLNITKQKQQSVAEDKKTQQTRRQETEAKPSKQSIAGSGPGRPLKHNAEQKSNNEAKMERKTDKKFKCPDEAAVQMKLEASKRKLQESYQQAENAKRQRTIQVMELHDIPKQGHMRPANHNRNWSNGRRQH